MRRRQFITLLGGTAAAWPLAARAQQAGKLPTIGVLGTQASVWGPWIAAFVARLHDLGWIEGRTIAIDYRWSQAQPERDAEIAAEFVRNNVDIVVTIGSAVATVKRATATIPIVFAIASDPVIGGLVFSLARPGGNVTGMSIQANDIASKRLELLREVVPHLRRLAIIYDSRYPAAVSENDAVQTVARTLDLQAMPHEIRRTEDIEGAFTTFKTQADAVYVVENALVVANSQLIATLALSSRLPTSFNGSAMVKAGGLMSYGPDFPALFTRTAELVDKILRGAKPADLPVEQPTKFDMVINLKTAKSLGIAVPDKMIALADEVIE